MTHGPKPSWKFPFKENVETRRVSFRTLFAILCLTVVFLVLITFSYYTSFYGEQLKTSEGFSQNVFLELKPNNIRDVYNTARFKNSSKQRFVEIDTSIDSYDINEHIEESVEVVIEINSNENKKQQKNKPEELLHGGKPVRDNFVTSDPSLPLLAQEKDRNNEKNSKINDDDIVLVDQQVSRINNIELLKEELEDEKFELFNGRERAGIQKADVKLNGQDGLVLDSSLGNKAVANNSLLRTVDDSNGEGSEEIVLENNIEKLTGAKTSGIISGSNGEQALDVEKEEGEIESEEEKIEDVGGEEEIIHEVGVNVEKDIVTVEPISDNLLDVTTEGRGNTLAPDDSLSQEVTPTSTEASLIDTDAASGYTDGGLTKTGTIDWNDERLDILHTPVPAYDSRYKNPCWEEDLGSAAPYVNNVYINFSSSAKKTLKGLSKHWNDVYQAQDKPKRLRCLPYFLIIGQPKCGSTELFWKLAAHPDIDAPPIKELHWWSRSRQGRRFSYSKIIPFKDYVDMFDLGATRIQERVDNMTRTRTAAGDDDDDDDDNDDDDDDEQEQIILGEASVSLFWDNYDWSKFPENRGLTEPQYVVAHYIQHIIPDVKLILILRDPVERLYSDYLYFNAANKSADNFHSAVKQAVAMYSDCIRQYGDRHCIYNNNLANKVKVRLRIGMYSVYLKDWLKLFPRQQFYVLRLEDYSKIPLMYIKQIFTFLDMRPLTGEEKEAVMASHISNVRKADDKKLGGMHEETRALLYKFYSRFNQELAELLDDTRLLWKK